VSGGLKDSYDNVKNEPITPAKSNPVSPNLQPVEGNIEESHVDGASHHLFLQTSPDHLSPPGLEQVYESEVANAAFTFSPKRSKLSREERIKLMRSKRYGKTNRGLAALLDSENDGDEQRPARQNWGSGTAVIAELQDVIWRIGERRR
jgi:hypothetical protein